MSFDYVDLCHKVMSVLKYASSKYSSLRAINRIISSSDTGEGLTSFGLKQRMGIRDKFKRRL